MSIQTKTERIDIRLSKDNKELLDLAAKINNTSVSDYILTFMLEKAEMDIKENEKVILSERAKRQILDSLANPAEPTQDLIDLFK